MADTPHNDVKEAIQDAITRTAVYRGIALCLPAITTTDTYVTHDDGSVTGRVFDTSCPPSPEVKALIDAWLDGTALPTLPGASQPPNDPPPSDPPPTLAPAVVTGTVAGVAVNVTAQPGQRVQLVPGDFQHGSVKYYSDGAIVFENSYVGAGNPTPQHMACSLTAVVGDKTFTTGAITIWYKSWTRPFWVVQPTVKDFDRNLFPNYGAGSEAASFADGYAKADNSPMGIGLWMKSIGTEGERPDLGLIDGFSACALTNPSAENQAVVRGQADATAPWPFHAIDTATNEMLDAYAYPKTSDLAVYRGVAGNPFPIAPGGCPYNLNGATGHAPAFNVVAAAMYATEYDKASLSHWTAYVACWWANFSYRLPNGPTQYKKNEGARGTGWTTRQLAQAARLSDKPEMFEAWLKLRLADLTSALAAAGPLPVVDAWLPYPTNDTATGWAFGPWQVLDMLGQSLGYVAQLGYIDALVPFKQLALVRMDSIDKCPHELASIYSLTVCEGGDRKGGARASSWAQALQFEAGINPKVAAALACAEGSQALQDAMGQTAPNNQPGDFLGYPASSTGYAAIMQPFLAYISDYYTEEAPRASAAWNTYKQYARQDWSSDPKYNIVPRAAL